MVLCSFTYTYTELTKDKNSSHSKLLFRHPDPLSGDDHPLDLSGSLVDLVNLGVSHQFLHRVVRVESVPTEYLHSISGGLVGNISGETLKYQFRYLRSVWPSLLYI